MTEDPRSGTLGQRILPDGREAVLYPMIYNVRLCVGEPGAMTYDNAWCYPHAHVRAALDALDQWDGEGDPPGPWIKRVGG